VYTSTQPDCDEYDQRWKQEFGVEVIRDRSKILLPTPRVISKLRKVLRTRQISTIWFGAAAPLALSARWLKRAGATHVVALTHGHEVWWSRVWPFSWLMSEIAKNLDIATYLGEFTRNSMAPRFKDSRKLIKIAPGIDTEHFVPHASDDLRKNYGIDTKPTIVSVGRLVHRKGQDRLVEAMPRILAQIPNAHLIFIGEGPHRKVLGLPVIGGASGGAPDAVKHGITGYVVDGNNVEEIANRSIELLRDSELRATMGAAGRKWVVDEWRWQIWSHEFNKALKI